ncbi:MAG: hypothetical protein U0840_25655 [Gemmataceae bacterium]
MGDLLQRGAEWLAGQLKAHAARDVVFRRGEESCTLRATVGKTLLKLTDSHGGVRMQWTDRDYIVDPLDLVLGGVAVLPRPGDTFEEVINSALMVFEVLPPGGDEDCYKMDASYRLLRIHTKSRGGS